MNRSNPLFVDSTKFQGDVIPCRIELSRVFLYTGESMMVRITDRMGGEDDILMQSEDGLFVARMRLRHQEQFTYQFFVRTTDKILWVSEKKTFQGTYLVTEEWNPLPNLEGSLSLQPKIKELIEPQRSLSKRSNYDGNLLASIINKWGF